MKSGEAVNELPKPDADACARSDVLVKELARQISDNNGLISFAEFMRITLYHPAYGYYSGGQTKFGEQGDFVTAPEVSCMFSWCLANQVADIRQLMPEAVVLEFGAGSGIMAADILARLELLDELPSCYYILELSAELKLRQKETLQSRVPHLLDKVVWLDELPAEPLKAIVLANEILDAMPVECFRVSDCGVQQLMIGYENGGLLSDYEQAGALLHAAVDKIQQRTENQLDEGYCSEVNLNIQPWLTSLYQCLDQGVVLLIDYGYPVKEYYLPERNGGTLICHYQHRAHANPFWYPGLQDITAFVDFTDVAHSASDAGFEVRGFTSQAAFLMSSGLADIHQQLVNDDPEQQVRLAQQIKTLTLPSEMGEKFKVMALTCSFDEPLSGFMLQDQRGRL